MTTQAAIPLKWYVPFATGDASRVEIPVTSSDATRASQTLGFPPLTMQPPAVGGVPPQGEDFNGAMNQVARVAWWVLNGGGWPYDATFATNSNIGGYPNGAVLQSADFLGQWISTADNNQNNPDTVGTNWVPGYQYGASALTGQTGGTVTLTPLQAAKRGLTISGTLTSALVVIYPIWVKDWSITNNTTGAFTVIAKTAAGSGVTIPQNGSPTPVAGDGTNITQNPQNIANGTAINHAVAVGQLYGGLKGISRNTAAGSLVVPTGVTTMYVSGTAPGGGGGSGGPSLNASSASCVGGGGTAGGAGQSLVRQAYTVTPGSTISWTMGSAGTGGAAPGPANTGNAGTAAGNIVISGSGFNGGTNVTLTGGGGGGGGGTATSGVATGGTGASPAFPSGTSGQDTLNGTPGGMGGTGASGPYGGGGGGGRGGSSGAVPGADAYGFGASGGGGGGCYSTGVGSAGKGGNGAPGLLIFEW